MSAYLGTEPRIWCVLCGEEGHRASQCPWWKQRIFSRLVQGR